MSDMTVDEYSRKLASDFLFYLEEEILHISPKTGAVIPFKLNQSQKLLHDAIEGQLKRQGYVRALVLKCRQPGVSTYIEGRFYWRTSQELGKTAMIVAHEDKAASRLFVMGKLFHERCPQLFRPATRFSNAKELVFDTDDGKGLKSQYIVQTAGSQRAGGRSYTLHYVHASEVSHWGEGGAAILGGLLESVPSEYPAKMGTEVIWETTANGLDPIFYEKWMEIVNADGATFENGVYAAKGKEYICIFIPYFYHDGYREQEPAKDPDEYETWLLSQKDLSGKNVDLFQIEWRRRKIESLVPPIGFTKEQFFKQEYPATPQEAFVSSGRGVFDTAKLLALIDAAPAPVARYDVIPGSHQWKSDPEGPLRVWKEPGGGSYVIGADVAEGLVHGDFSVADVVDHATGEQVAQWHGKIHPESFGDVLAALGKRYNGAWLVPERNNNGLLTVTRLERIGYKKLYVETIAEPPLRPRKRYGWVTSSKNKSMIIQELVKELDEGTHGLNGKDTLREMLVFKQHEDGKLGAIDGQNDDRVMARAIAGHVRKILPMVVPASVQQVKTVGWAAFK